MHPDVAAAPALELPLRPPAHRVHPRAVMWWRLRSAAALAPAASRAAQGRAFWDRTSDPARALANVLERDRRFTDRVRAECEELGLPVIEVDGTADVAQVNSPVR